jgi:hypothetical protein
MASCVARRIFAALALPALLAACPGEDRSAVMVVGVQGEELGPLVGSLHVIARVDGAVVADEITQVPALPKELAIEGAPGARAEVLVEAFSPGAQPGDPPFVTRLATAHLEAGPTRLLRMQLQGACAALPGGRAPVTCAAPETCISGVCASSEVGPAELEDYAERWPENAPDACRPARSGPPEVILGTGQTDYTPLKDEQEVMLEKGPQGGHHIWIAVRMKNLRRSGSVTAMSATLPDEGDAPVPPMAFVLTFDPDEGAYCKLSGMRYQLDTGASDLRTAYKRFLGKRLAVTVEVTDSTGASASSTRIVRIAPLLLCPDGTTQCNEGT